MSKTMSNPNDWMQFYQQDFFPQAAPRPPGGGAASSEAGLSAGDRSPDDAVASIGATVPSPASGPSSAGGLGNLGMGASPASRLSPEGGVAKPVRRRSRASRRTPTTVMNTDTTNFRALVQQFTGGPSAPFASGSGSGMLNFGFAGLGQGRGGVAVPSAFHSQYQYSPQQQQQLHHQHQQYLQQTAPQYVLSLNGNNNPGDVSLYHHRLGSSRSGGASMAAASSDGFILEGQVPARPSSSSEDNRSNNNYIFR